MSTEADVPPRVFRRRTAEVCVIALSLAVALLSQFYRTSHAVIAPDLVRELGVPAATLASMTSIYYLMGAIAQLPAGMLLDRFGVRTVVPLLLVCSAIGAWLFAAAHDATGLVLGRALMGLGLGAVVMGCLVLMSRWLGLDRFAIWLGIVLGASQLGNLLATTPMAAMTLSLGWRGAFLVLATLPLLIAALFYIMIRDVPPDQPAPHPTRPPESVRQVMAGVVEILMERRLWPVFAIASCGYACIISILGLWGAPYLHDIYGMDAIARGNVMLVMALALAIGQMSFAQIARKTGNVKVAIIAGVVLAIACLTTMALAPRMPVWAIVAVIGLLGWAGGFTGQVVLHGRMFYPEHLVGRGMTTTNSFVFAGVAVVQWLTGLVMDHVATTGDAAAAGTYATIFALLSLTLAIALVVYLFSEVPATATPAVPN
jgi:predicted MFS family arabinose efflux permease